MGQTELVYTGVKFDSDEEVFVAMWLEELKEAGYVKSWDKTLEPIELTPGFKLIYDKTTILKTKTKTERKEHVLLRPSEYTPDFKVYWTLNGWLTFNSGIYSDVDIKKTFFTRGGVAHPTYIEVKPSFDQNNMERLFRNNQKFVWYKHQIFVNLVEPVSLFKKTFLPLQAAPYFKYKRPTKTKNKGDWKFDFVPKTLKEFLCQ